MGFRASIAYGLAGENDKTGWGKMKKLSFSSTDPKTSRIDPVISSPFLKLLLTERSGGVILEGMVPWCSDFPDYHGFPAGMKPPVQTATIRTWFRYFENLLSMSISARYWPRMPLFMDAINMYCAELDIGNQTHY